MKGNKLFKKIDRFIGVPLLFVFGLLTRLFPNPSAKIKAGDRVLAVKLSALGDTFILLPTLKALKQKVGHAGKLVVIATPINQAALEGFSYIDEILILDFGRLTKSPKALFGFLTRLRDAKPQFALDFDQWLRISPLLCFFSGASVRVGFKTPGQHRHFTYHRTAPNLKTRHESEQFASIAELTGIDPTTVDPCNGFLEQENLYRTVKNSSPQKKLVHIHPGCGSYGWQRAWPEDYYAQLIQKLTSDPEIQIRLTGMGSYEEDLNRGIAKKADRPVDDRSGKLTLAELADLLREADLVVCGNTGVLHLAAGLGRPVVTMNGPANWVKWGAVPPRSGENGGDIRNLWASVPCSPCTTLGYEYGCPARPCMESISVDAVYRECRILLEKTKV